MARRKKQNDEEQENSENINNESDDTFGLPEVEYEPLKRDEPKEEEPQPEPVVEAETTSEPVYEKPYEVVQETEVEEGINEVDADDKPTYGYIEEEEPSQWPKILGIAVVVLFAAAAIYYFAVYLPSKHGPDDAAAKAKARREQAQREADEKAAAEARRLEAERHRADSLASIPKVGTLEVLEGRTGKYYVVIASAIDVDLLTDYANQLVKKGSTVKIIPPFGKTKFHRLAVDSKDTYADAQSTADGLKGGDFGSEIWVVKY